VASGGVAGRDRVPRRDRRDELLRAAVDVGRRSGLSAIEAAAVAVKAGVSKALVYYYFPTHRDLQAAVVQAAADELLAGIRSVVEPGADPAESLQAGLEAAIAYIETQPEAFIALSRSSGFHPKLLEVFEYARDGIADVVAEGIGLTELTAGQRIALRSWIALTEEAVLHWTMAAKPVPRADLVVFCRDAALHVLASPLAALGPLAVSPARSTP
jgi:AcrR family transcriptional regulator